MLRRRFFISQSSGQQNNEIWYTTTNGNVLQASTVSTFDKNADTFVSNTYSGGQGVLQYQQTVTQLENNMFRGCSKLASVTIPNSVTSIGNYVFNRCSGLASVTIPNSVTSIGYHAFSDCSGLTNVTIPNSVTSIGSNVFNRCYGLRSVTIGNSVTSIKALVFNGCSALTAVYISDLSAWCKIDFTDFDSNPIFYAHNLYLDGLLVKNLEIPSDITIIKKYAFRACHMTSVTIPNSVTSIDDYAFMHCTKLTSVVIPDSVTTIGGSAFQGKTLSNDYTQLAEVTIGSGVTSIGSNAFKEQAKLKAIYCKATFPPTIQSNTFEGVPSDCVLYVPIGCEGLYSISANWQNFTNIQGYEF